MRHFILLFLSSGILLHAQQTGNNWHWSVQGYVKYLNTVNFHDADTFYTDNLWHPRLDFKGYYRDTWTFALSSRNRILYGDRLKNPLFDREILDTDTGVADLSFLPVNRDNLLVSSVFDRLYLQYSSGKWNLRVGRQRINWGINTVWNPNDIFNTSNYLDWDYEEKPGSDAVRLHLDTGGMSSIEGVYKAEKPDGKRVDTYALRYQFNLWQYDFQCLGAVVDSRLVAGIGWAGSIGDAGFKGEWSYFSGQDERGIWAGSISWDYAFQKGTNLLVSGLYNGGYQEDSSPVLMLSGERLQARNLFPSEYAVLGQWSGDIGAPWRWSISGIYGNAHDMFILIPQLDYSLKDNWDLSLYGQSFFAGIPGYKQWNFVTFRLRWSFSGG